jgi:hypothetical protein
MTRKIEREYFVPYKYYFGGLIKLKDGWVDKGISGTYGDGNMTPYHFTVSGETFSGKEERKYKRICPNCRIQFRLCLMKHNHAMYFYCPNCGHLENISYK